MHLMPSGKTCGRKDGHAGYCYSIEAVARKAEGQRQWRATPEGREAHRNRMRQLRATPEGLEANRKCSREGWRKMRATPEGLAANREAANRSNRKSGYAYGRRRRARLKGIQQEEISKLELCERQDWRCYICGCDLRGIKVEIEHLVPIIAGLPHVFRTLAASCWTCNRGEGGKHRKALVPYLLERQRDGRPLHPNWDYCLKACPLFQG